MKRIVNKAAKAEYQILEKYEAGMVLYGAEVKSIRVGKVSMKGSFVKVIDGEAYLHNMHIQPYSFSSEQDYEPTRQRKLLLKKKEILKIEQHDQKKGVTIVPLSIYESGNKFKLELGVGKGKKEYEKRSDIKKRDLEREMSRDFKNSQIR